MKSFELDIFIDCRQDKVYDHLAEPLNLIGLQPLLTEIDVLKEKIDENNIRLRPFYTVETFRWMGLPIYKNKIYSVIHLTKPREEMEFHVYSKPNIEIVFKYQFKKSNDNRTQITQTVHFVKVNKLLETFVVDQAKQAQRALLSNLKVRLEKH
ncbi:MAG: hypothetical protein IPP66_00565 [Anaerolineales bacterium]|nr:hypothetical protein [Anaerolineales bacterium]